MHSRDFVGLVSPLFFNIDLHSAHHLRGSAHWSELPGIHARIAPILDARLLEPSLVGYCLRSQSLVVRRRPNHDAAGCSPGHSPNHLPDHLSGQLSDHLPGPKTGDRLVERGAQMLQVSTR
jgi:fatty acid desaturase